MSTDRCCCWGYTDHQGTLIITGQLERRDMPITSISLFTCD
ncbi:unnamed protein product, partial [Staurois parvus]